MSLHRLLFAALLTSSFTALVPTPAQAIDFTCHPERDHCLSLERDNFTFYVDTDGSMNADSGGGDTYWEMTVDSLEELADDNHVSGPCQTVGNCRSEGCDGVRIGVGFFSDNSIDDSSDGVNAYRAVSAGENRRDDFKDAIDDEAAGLTGDPGIETLRCPANGAGQTDIFTCPVEGTPKRDRITCPPDGGFQVNEIEIPPMGVAQRVYIGCPRMALYRTWHVEVTTAYPYTTYRVDVDGIPVSYGTGDIATNLEIAIGLYDNAVGNPLITSNFNVWRSGTDVRFQRIVADTEFSITNVSCWDCNIGAWPPADLSGLPTTPSAPHNFRFRLNGEWMEHAHIGAGESTTNVCNQLASAVNLSLHPVDATVSGSTLFLRSELAGKPFTVTDPDSSLTGPTLWIPNAPGLPGDPEAPTTFSFEINGTEVSYNHSGASETTTNVCNQLATEVTNSGENVVGGCTGGVLRITSTVGGLDFTVSAVQNLSDLGIVIANGPGLPATPGAGYDYSFDLNTSEISATGDASSTSQTVCTDLYNSILASGEPVNATLVDSVTPSYILIREQDVGAGFTISGVPAELEHDVELAGSLGLPGIPGPGHTYAWDYTDVDGVTTTMTAIPTIDTTAGVCSALAAAFNAHPAFNASATMTSVTVTPAVQGASWTFSNIDSSLGHSTTRSGLPATPGPYHVYEFDIEIDGNTETISYTDDGSPTQAEICAGLTTDINATVGGDVDATHDGVTITITGLDSDPFNIDEIDSMLLPHVVVQVAGQGPSAYGDLGARINADQNIGSRTQNAVVITHRGPEDFADFNTAVTELCARRDNATAPATTYFIGMGIDADERALLDILAAAGGSGSCNEGCTEPDTCLVDPCMGGAVIDIAMTPLVTCDNVVPTPSAADLKYRILDLIETASCTFDLDVPPTYSGGQPPDTYTVVNVQIRNWTEADGRPPVFRVGQNPPDGKFDDYHDYLEDNHDFDDDDAAPYAENGWDFVPGDRSKIRFTPALCAAVRSGEIRQVRTHVGCQCANQGDACTTTIGFDCKSLIGGECATISDCAATDTVCLNGHCMATCTADQLLNMRCATGVLVCDNGVEICTAGGDNAMPEICNGIDDDCDGIVDNLSNSEPADFGGEDVGGRNCNFRDVCMCPAGAKDVSSVGNDIGDHLDSWSGTCQCGESLEDAAYSDGEPAQITTKPGAFDEPDAACTVTTTSRGAGAGLALFGAILGALVWRRRR